MKSFLTVIISSISLCALGDGMFNFANAPIPRLFDAPVADWDGTNKLFGPTFAADLYYGPLGTTNPALLTPLRQPTTFATNGYFYGGSRIIPGAPFGNLITVQVRVWDVPDGDSYEAVLNSTSPTARVGQSNLFPLYMDWPPGAGSELTGLIPFNTVPVQTNPPARPLAPPITVTTASTNQLIFAWPSYWQGWTFVLQQSPTLGGGDWLTLTNAAMLTGSQSQVLYQIETAAPSGQMFYRLVSQ